MTEQQTKRIAQNANCKVLDVFHDHTSNALVIVCSTYETRCRFDVIYLRKNKYARSALSDYAFTNTSFRVYIQTRTRCHAGLL